jgi:hypothetical protein
MINNFHLYWLCSILSDEAGTYTYRPDDNRQCDTFFRRRGELPKDINARESKYQSWNNNCNPFSLSKDLRVSSF